MKKPLQFILILIFSTQCYSQISLEKGYFITNTGQKIDCLIKNVDWLNNPTEFEYKIKEGDALKKESISQVKEFGIDNFSRFIRSSVNIDRSINKLNHLSTQRNPQFKEEELFLKVLVSGEANLFQYDDINLTRFFFSTNNTNGIEQLVFKNYKANGDMIGENNKFKQQLLNELKCPNITFKDIKNISYEKDDLVHLFISYNQCNNSEVVNYVKKQKQDLINLNARIGFNNASFALQNEQSNSSNVDFKNKIILRVGLEAEFIMPFHNNKWALVVEPTYQAFKAEKEIPSTKVTVDYTSIEIPLGIRHYFYLNNNSKFFINGSLILDFVGKSNVTYDSGLDLEITKSSNLGFGIGYKQNDKYSLELRYHTKKNLLNSYQSYDSEYNSIAVILGYTLF